jgi:ssDNA-binding replication factor A large subunit
VAAKNKLYDQVKTLLSEDEFQNKIDKKIKEWNELIDENAAAALVANELGRSQIEFTKISEVKNGVANISARIDFIDEPRELVTKRGPGRLVRVTLSDDTGKCRLALWDNDIELIEKLGLQEGKKIRIMNGYVKISKYGIDVSRGRWGAIDLDD